MGRAGVLETLNGVIQTPVLSLWGPATTEGADPEQVKDLGTPVVLANTYHLYLQPVWWDCCQVWRIGQFHELSKVRDDDRLGRISSVFFRRRVWKRNFLKLWKSMTRRHDSRKIWRFWCSRLAKIGRDVSVFSNRTWTVPIHYITPEKSIQIQQHPGRRYYFCFWRMHLARGKCPLSRRGSLTGRTDGRKDVWRAYKIE